MALMSTIARTVAKRSIRSSLGDSEATERIITAALQDLESIGELDEASRATVLAAFEHAMHSAFFLPSTLAVGVIFLAASMNIWPSKRGASESLEAEYQGEDA
ncbi:hypothetical protein M426DRAFT_77449 [Hypoxylon sp. CI-4A]|nr:hypothetical protein M426DRAFT_77449 [Hypoxylon sp. CI-4A]